MGDSRDRTDGARRAGCGGCRVRRRSRADLPHRTLAGRLRDVGHRLSLPGALRGPGSGLRRDNHLADPDARARLASIRYPSGRPLGGNGAGGSRHSGVGLPRRRGSAGTHRRVPAHGRRARSGGSATSLHRVSRRRAQTPGFRPIARRASTPGSSASAGTGALVSKLVAEVWRRQSAAPSAAREGCGEGFSLPSG